MIQFKLDSDSMNLYTDSLLNTTQINPFDRTFHYKTIKSFAKKKYFALSSFNSLPHEMLSSTLRTASIGSRFASRHILRRTQIPACALHTSRKTKSAAAAVASTPQRFGLVRYHFGFNIKVIALNTYHLTFILFIH